MCGGYCNWHHPAIIEATQRSERLCGRATIMHRGCRLPAMDIAGVRACWVHASLTERHAVLRVLDPDGEPRWEAASYETDAVDSSTKLVLFAPREGAPAMRHNELERGLREVPSGSLIRLSLARRSAPPGPVRGAPPSGTHAVCPG